jgi:hypothetical protein
MPNEDPNAVDVSKQQPSTTESATESVEPLELAEDALETVSGGLHSTGGSSSTAICLF